MSAPTIPLVVEATLPEANYDSTKTQAIVYLGDRTDYVKNLQEESQISFFIYDRVDPMKGPVFTVATSAGDTTTVPDGLAKYANDQYLMIVATQNATLYFVPQGALYQFLVDNGAFKQLKRWETIAATQYQCGTSAGIAYIMATIPGQGAVGIEMFKFQSISARIDGGKYIETGEMTPFILTAQLFPVDVDGSPHYSLEEV